MIKGIEYDFGGIKSYMIPPLDCEALEIHGDKFDTMDTLPLVKKIGLTVDLATAALARNYPEIKREEVAKLVDIGNMSQVIQIIMGVSGLVRAAGELQGKASQ